MTHFGERDGAQGKGYAEGASTAGPSGLIYFAGEGVTAFDPRQVSVNPYRPGIVFTGARGHASRGVAAVAGS